MSTSNEISRLTAARNTIRDKLIAMGLAGSSDKIDTLATIVDGIAVQGAITATVQEGATYTIPSGYHNGAGTVSGIAGGGNYTLQEKTVTPTKSQQTITPDSGNYGLSDVIVNAIPEAYQNVSSVTATASEVLSPKVFVAANGSAIAGTMINNGTVTQVLSASTTSYTIPSGYHSGSGTVSIVLEEKTVAPSTTGNTIVTPSTGKVLSKVTVGGIPQNYIAVDDADAVASQLLKDKIAYTNAGESGGATEPSKIVGTMPNNGAVTSSLSTSVTSYTIPSGYHNGAGSVSITLETKLVTPAESTQTVYPSSGKVLSAVTVDAIPSNYGDSDNCTASAADILSGQMAIISVDDAAALATGTMPNRGAVSITLSTSSTSYTVPTGYHNGSGTVAITLETVSATPSTAAQTITPSTGKVLSSVAIGAIPSEFKDITGVTAVPSKVLAGVTFINASGSSVEGTMANNGAISGTIDGLTTTSYSISSGYTSGGTVSLTSDIETSLAAI